MLSARIGIGLAVLMAVPLVHSAADPAKSDKDPVLTDAAGTEVVLKKWKIAGGTRKLAWLPDKPEAFEFREFGSTNYKEGVLTLVPMSRIGSIKYDYEKCTATLEVAGLEKPLQGTSRLVAINSITIAADVDQGNAGVAELRFRGGVVKGGFREIKFPSAKAPDAPTPKGELYSFLTHPEKKGEGGAVMTAVNVQALYRLPDGSEKLAPWLMFKTTLKVEIAKIRKMEAAEKPGEWELELNDGMKLSVTLLATAMIDGKQATLVGLLGNAPAGWRLFPMHTFTQFQPGELKVEEKKKEPAPKKKGSGARGEGSEKQSLCNDSYDGR